MAEDIGLLAVQGGNTQIAHNQLPFAIAFLAGFSERFSTRIIDKVMTIILSSEEKKPEERKAEPQIT